ncbi:hypothetical protein E1294_17825 [Nonomuraea diastatica]|uniref:Uncharacterized protein n=1 Tax=Nonomuraea diastatica TaxID=1848329 RepID=A0A4R4WSC9_9ACTN|nr:hypothetical protein E1294_17825 [Nonomuraea diastatica]
MRGARLSWADMRGALGIPHDQHQHQPSANLK